MLSLHTALWELFEDTPLGVKTSSRTRTVSPAGNTEEVLTSTKGDPMACLAIARSIADFALRAAGKEPMPPMTVTIVYEGPEPASSEAFGQADSNPGSSSERKETP